MSRNITRVTVPIIAQDITRSQHCQCLSVIVKQLKLHNNYKNDVPLMCGRGSDFESCHRMFYRCPYIKIRFDNTKNAFLNGTYWTDISVDNRTLATMLPFPKNIVFGN